MTTLTKLIQKEKKTYPHSFLAFHYFLSLINYSFLFFSNFCLRELASAPSLHSIDCSSSSAVDETVLKAFIHQAKESSSNTTSHHRLQKVSMVGCNICSSIPWEVMDDLENWKDCRLRLLDLSFNEISHGDKTQLLTSWCVAVNKKSDVGGRGVGLITRRKCLFTFST